MSKNSTKTLFVIGLSTFALALMLFNACSSKPANQTSTQSSEAAEELNQAEADLAKSKEAYIEKYNAFKMETDTSINENRRTIEELKLKMKSKNKETRAKWERQLDELEQKNENMKARLDDYKEEGEDNWESFKTEFNHDMDNLGNALRDLTKSNTD
jgi:TolA-binding protein